MRLFADTNGNFLDDDGDTAFIGEQATVAAIVDVTNSSPGPAATDIAVTVPGALSTDFDGVDITTVRVATATPATASVAYSDVHIGRIRRQWDSDAGRQTRSCESNRLTVTFTGVAPGAAVRLDVQGTLNDNVDADDVAGGAEPGLTICADVTGSNGVNQAATNDCDDMSVQPATRRPGIGVLALVVQPTWTLDEATSTGTMTLPSTGFPPATFTTDQRCPGDRWRR